MQVHTACYCTVNEVMWRHVDLHMFNTCETLM